MKTTNSTDSQPLARIGHGFDVHAFGKGDHIVLGGVRITHKQGLAAHSDGDVLIHAVCDAFLGAIAAGDIGQHYPDTDPEYQNIDSSILLADVYSKVLNSGYQLGNLDVTIVAQVPVLSMHIPGMCNHLAEVLAVTCGQINIKATTTEKIGYIGREEGLAAHAVVMINRVSK